MPLNLKVSLSTNSWAHRLTGAPQGLCVFLWPRVLPTESLPTTGSLLFLVKSCATFAATPEGAGSVGCPCCPWRCCAHAVVCLWVSGCFLELSVLAQTTPSPWTSSAGMPRRACDFPVPGFNTLHCFTLFVSFSFYNCKEPRADPPSSSSQSSF